jgi:opacity protein-like surface antigen
MKKSLLLAVMMMAFASFAMATDCNFDSFTGSGVVPDGYCGVNSWNGVWNYYDSSQPPYTAFSPFERVYTPATGAGEYLINIGTPVVFNGAYFAGYSSAVLNFDLYLGGNLVWTSSSLAPSATPTWLASGYSGLVDTVGVNSARNDFYVMDDFTYNGTTTPEPGTLGLLATGAFGALGVIRRRFAK